MSTLIADGRPQVKLDANEGGDVRAGHRSRVVAGCGMAGKLMPTLANNDQIAGYYHVNRNRADARGRSVPAGVYFCTLAAEGQRFTRKVVLTE